jgi:uncharacterized protein YgbK (DUF1537 family)
MSALIVIDDDPTGAQEEAGVLLLFDWSARALQRARRRSPRAIHLLTNSRALSEDDAYQSVRDAIAAVRRHLPGSRVVLRGDSTLRAHLLPEYLAFRDQAFPGRNPPHMLIPALPSAGRVTIDGTQWLIRDGVRVALAETEYARDHAFSYTNSRLLDWAGERSDGYFKPEEGRELPLTRLRANDGAATVAATVRELARTDRATVFAPDAETTTDLEILAEGIRNAEAAGTDVIVRCAPAFVGVAAGTVAHARATVPTPGRGVLLIVGSHVATTTRQLERLLASHRQSLVEVDPALLITAQRRRHSDHVIAEARLQLATTGLAIVATSRPVGRVTLSQEEGMQVARGLAEIATGLREHADVFVAKGGITSALVAQEGLGAHEAEVIGPVVDGVSLWQIATPGRKLPLIVFPGNVGGSEALSDLIRRLLLR